MIAVSTYSGECDGLGYAAELAGIEVAAYCEIDPKRRKKLAEKHPGKPIFHSDEELTVDGLYAYGIYPDLLFGGPPCQPFSCAGSQRGTADPRHRWPQMLRLIQECRPSWVVVENVGNFANMALDLVWANLEEENYEVGTIVLPASAVGAPHRRDRCFVVAHAGRFGWGEQKIQGEQPRGTDVVRSGETSGLADAIRARESQPRGIIAQCGGWAFDGSQSMADADSEGLQGRDSEFLQECSGKWSAGESGACMGDAESSGLQKPGQKPGYETLSGKNRVKCTDWRPIESRLGRVLDGVSDRLDEVMSTWPAWRGQEQYPWEPPRTVVGLKERERRIESLGLAVLPWQPYPIFSLIKEIHDYEEERRTPC